jgi:hypothetical protein
MTARGERGLTTELKTAVPIQSHGVQVAGISEGTKQLRISIAGNDLDFVLRRPSLDSFYDQKGSTGMTGEIQ